MKDIRVGLIGYGYSGATFHAPLISVTPGMTLASIASSNATKVGQDFPDALLADSPEALIRATDIDLVVIATPNSTHHALAEQALLADKHVVLEKPFTVSTEEAQGLTRLAQERKRTLSVFHNRRWDGDFLTVKHCIESGRLGEVNTYQAHFDRYRPAVRQRWREQDLPGSGTLYDLGSHLIDQALVLFGMPDTVSGDIGCQRVGAATTDYFHLILGYSRKRVILHSGSIIRNPGPHFQVHGSAGSYIKFGLDPQEEALRLGRRPGDVRWGIEPETSHGELTFEQDGKTVIEKIETLPGAYQTYYQGIADAISRGKPVPVRADAALNVIKIIEWAMQSSREQRVITI